MLPYQRRVYNLQFLLKTQHWSLEQLQELQLKGLKAMVSFARENCRYYRDLPDKIKDIDDIKDIPILTKTDIKDNFNDILVPSIPHEIEETGGTVSRVKVARDNILQKQLGLKRFESWYGTGIGKVAHLWGSVEGANFWENDHTLWMPVEKLNEKTAKRYLWSIRNMKPDLLHGYALPLSILAHYANEFDIHPHCGVVRSECETLTQSMRIEIEEAFNIKYGLFNLYGSRDLGGMAQDCELHKGLHTFIERYVIEDVNGKFLFTDLINYAFPLIRYENQDIGEFTNEKCSCGRELPTIKPIVGRILNYLKTKKGEWVTAFVFYLPINYYDIHHGTDVFDWVESFQIRQRKAGEITLLLKSWGGTKPPKDMSKVMKVLNQYIKSEDFNFSVEIVDKIPLSKSGKQLSVDTTLRRWK